jgi:hypothetical protein
MIEQALGADATPPSGAIIWQVRRRPSRRYRTTTAILVFGIGAFLAKTFASMLLVSPDRWQGIVAGLLIAIPAYFWLTAGATARVDDAGRLFYGWGSTMNISVDLRLLTGWRMVDGAGILGVSGLLYGVGAAIDPQQVEFLNHRGPSPLRMRDQERKIGVGLVLEFLVEEDLAALQALQARFAQDAVPKAMP